MTRHLVSRARRVAQMRAALGVRDRDAAEDAVDVQAAEDRACALTERMFARGAAGQSFRIDPQTAERIDTWEEGLQKWLQSEQRTAWLARGGRKG